MLERLQRARKVLQHTVAFSGLLLAASGAAAAQGEPPVARLSVELPEMEFFILQATLPVPPGTYVPPRTTSPLAIRSGGDAVTTQVEVVSRYPDPSDGAAVVEVLARVSRPAGAAPGDEVTFDVVRHEHSPGTVTPTAAVQQLLAQPGGLVLRSRDLRGNVYEADLLQKLRLGQAGTEALRRGPFVTEVRTHEIMAPGTAGAGQRLPHLMGVHATVRHYASERFIALDLHVHNGLDSLDASTGLDDALADVYFDRLDLDLPSGWRLVPVHASPQYGAPVTGGGRSVWPIVDALRQGQFHVFPQQAQFSRRFLIAADAAAETRGRQVVERRTQGFVAPAEVGGRALWSWWNPETPGYLPQRNVLPALDFLDRASLVADLEGQRREYATLLATGGKSPTSYPFARERMGWCHPWGVGYGGMTGGTEIEQWPGVDVAWARSQQAVQLMEIQAQAYEDRQPVALYSLSGRPTFVEDIVQPQGNHGPWIPTFFDLRPIGSGDPFGLQSADRSQPIEAYEGFLLPHYEKDLRTYQAIDLQHLTRYMNAWLVLAWLTNDAEAKRAIELVSELNRITFSEYYNSNYGHVQRVGLLSKIHDAQVASGRGGEFGRGVAWGLQASLAAYALGDDVRRARYRPWLAQTVRTARQSVSTCTGNPTSIQISKHFKGVYQSRQSFEVSYFLHAVQGLRRTVFEDVDPATHALATEVLLEGARSTISPPYWDATQGGQCRLVATRRMPLNSPDFCANVPEDGYDTYFDRTTARATWAYAFDATGDLVYFQRAAESVGGSHNLLYELELSGLGDLHDHAPLLALIQARQQ